MRGITSRLLIFLLAASVLTTIFTNDVRSACPNGVEVVLRPREKHLTVSFSAPQIERIDPYSWLKMKNCSYLTLPGQPMLPTKTVTLKLPEKSVVSEVRVHVEETSLQERFLVLPAPTPSIIGSQTPLKISEDPTIYANRDPFPKEWYVYREAHGIDPDTHTLATYLTITIFPLRYLPLDRQILQAKNAEITIFYDERTKVLTLESGPKNIIITSSFLATYARELAEWKNSTGISSKVLNTTWIYSNFAGADNQEKIRNCIKNFSESYGTNYVTIFGDADQVPVRYAYVPDSGAGETYVPTDLYYADLDGTWDDNGDGIYADQGNDTVDGLPDVYIGRIPPSLTQYAQTAVDKIKGYQQHFDTSQNWTRRILLAAGTGHNGVENLFGIAFPFLKDYIASMVTDKDTVKLYQLYGNLSTGSMGSHINEGCLFLNFAGHGDPDTGLFSAGWLFYWVVAGLIWNGFGITDVQTLTNGFKLPVVTTMSCSTARFDDVDCIGEWFVLEPDGGAIGYFGATRIAYGYPNEEVTTGLMGEMDWRIYEAYNDGYTKLGQMWSVSVNRYVQSHIWSYSYASMYDVKTMMEFVLLGDPTVRIYHPNYPETLHVPEECPTIQAVINAAYNGDSIMVSSGTYYENVVVNKTVSLIGEDPDATVIDGLGAGNVVTLTADGALIENFTINGGTCGILVNQVRNCTISRNRIVDNDLGIHIVTSTNSLLKENSMMGNARHFSVTGTSISHFIHNIDDTNTIEGRPIFYWIEEHDMVVPANAGYVALVNCSQVIVRELDLSNNGEGVLLAYSEHCQVYDNTMANNSYGVYFCYSPSNSISGNTITASNNYGIWLNYYSTNNSISGNNITATADNGIYLAFSSCNSISGNDISACGRHGVGLGYSSNNILYQNKITACSRDGIVLDSYSNNNTVCQNTVAANMRYGVYLLSSSNNNRVYQNNITANNDYGIRLSSSSGNRFYHNNFVDNSQQVGIIPSGYTSFWDDGYPSAGNYWSDYTGPDADGDGVGDTPYVIDPYNADNYPLMLPYRGHNVAVLNVEIGRTIIALNMIQKIEVEAANIGSFPQALSVTVYANATETQTLAVSLSPSDSTALTFFWDTAGTSYGHYVVIAYAWPVPDEADVDDNLYVFKEEVCITIPGDVDGDGDIDIFDIVKMAGVYGIELPDPTFEPNCDIDGDGDIDIFDIVIAAGHYGDSW